MVIQSRWVVSDETANQIARAITLKPRLDYATSLVDRILGILGKKRFEVNKNNLESYKKIKESKLKSAEFSHQLNVEFEVFYAIEALRQARRCIDSVFGLGNITLALAPTISIVRTVRSRLILLIPETDASLGELSLILGGIIIDTGQLTDAKLDFEEANLQSSQLLDQAKLIADSKIYKQFPNVDFS